MGKRSMEIKVGLFLLLSIAILVGFLFILGTFDFSEGHVLYVDFTSSGGLRNGAKVKIAGVPAGKVKDIEFIGGKVRNQKGDPIYVRVRMEIEPTMAPTVTEGTQVFVSTEGILGEKYLELSPGPEDGPSLPAESIIAGDDPVEMQVLMSRGAETLEKVQQMLDGDSGELESIGDSLRQVLGRVDRITQTIDDELPGLLEEGRLTLQTARDSMSRIDSLVDEGKTLINQEDGVRDAVANVARIGRQLEAELPDMVDTLNAFLQEGRIFVASSQEALGRVEEELAQTTREARQLLVVSRRKIAEVDFSDLVIELRQAISKLVEDFSQTGKLLAQLAGRTDVLVGDLGTVVADVRDGKGTLGALLREREVYDDIREFILDLKRNPWKVLWKP
jgi:phospholipid/cholesterol/gamma-HCH transport system substrate-binding protein